MRQVVRGLVSALVVSTLAIVSIGPAYGQGATTSTLSGIAVDTSGAVIPGADVTVKHVATGVTQTAVTNADGAFSFPAVTVGTYTVTVTLSGFKTFVANDVVLTSGSPASVRATLEIGGVEEQVVVSSASEIVQSQSTTIASTINTNQITKLPLTSRSAMDFVNFLPGVSTPGGNRDATINGLPRGTINITLDGVNVQDNTLRSTDGFFAIVSPRLDAIEEVSVTTASQGADVGQGAVQIKFVTRSGTNKFSGSGYWYYRNDDLNANTWFNNRSGTAKANLLQNQGGVRTGGPIVIPGLFDGRNKAFFFVNYEELHQPSDTTRQRTILNPAAMAGNFTFTGTGGTQTVNVLQLAARNGLLATPDPTISTIMGNIRSAVDGGSLETIDPNLQRFTFNVPVETMRRYPTFRVDYNLTTNHRASFSYNYQKFTDFPDTLNNRDPSFPGFPVTAGQSSERLGWSGSVRSTLTSTLVNEARVGYSGAPVTFFGEMNVGMFGGSFVPQQGFSLRFPTINSLLQSPGNTPAPQSRNANSLLIEDTVNWLKGAHNISMGGSFTQYDIWSINAMMVPNVTFNDIVPSDPATSVFTNANFPGASQANLQAAQRLFNLLTGRISTIEGDARLDENTGEYQYVGPGRQNGRLRESGVFVQDSWRIRPNLTLNAGLRYDIQFPFYPLNSLYSVADITNICGRSGAATDNSCNLFQSGYLPGVKPTFSQYTEGTRAYNVDYDNFSPTVGAAWTPSKKTGFLGSVMGPEGDFVLRAGYSRAFSRPGLSDFTTNVFNANPGIRIVVNREDSLGNLAPLPLLLRDQARLGPPSFPTAPVYPLTDVVTEDIRGFDPNIQVPYADSWSMGVQRGIGSNMAIEVRYVGTRAKDQWLTQTNGNNNNNQLTALNYNEYNIFDNGFINEFRQAQTNLQANIAAGRGNTFAFTGAPGTAPLPIFLGFFNGINSSQASNSAVYTGGNWTNQTFLNFLAARNPNPFGFASGNATGLLGSATLRGNASNAGIPANYFIVNPDLIGGAIVSTNIGSSKYDALQVEFRRRYSDGLQFQTSYVFGKAYISDWETFRQPQFYIRDAGSPGDVTHQFKANIVYDLPFGQGRRFGSNANGVVDRVIGGWQIGLSTRLQSGRLLDLGNVRLVGMSENDVQNMFKLRFDNEGKKVWMLPQDVIDNTILAFSVSPTTASGYAGASPTGRYFMPANGPDCIEVDPGNNSAGSGDYGQCGTRSLVVTGPLYQQHDIRISKRTRIVGTVDFEFAAEMLNAFNQANFLPAPATAGVPMIGSTLANYEVTTLTGTNTSRIIQLVGRINW
jgi:outer membrane receptor protein involved in Fe transport